MASKYIGRKYSRRSLPGIPRRLRHRQGIRQKHKRRNRHTPDQTQTQTLEQTRKLTHTRKVTWNQTYTGSDTGTESSSDTGSGTVKDAVAMRLKQFRDDVIRDKKTFFRNTEPLLPGRKPIIFHGLRIDRHKRARRQEPAD